MQHLEAQALCGEKKLRHVPLYKRSTPKHVVFEGSMTFAEDKRPEANLIV